MRPRMRHLMQDLMRHENDIFSLQADSISVAVLLYQKSVLLFKGFHMSGMRMDNLKADVAFSSAIKDSGRG